MDAKRILGLFTVLFFTAVSAFGDQAEDYFRQADAKYRAGDWDGAIADFSKIIELKPEIEGVYIGRASAKAQKGDFAGAIEDYGKAIELRPDFSEAYYGRGMAKSRMGNFESALADLNRAIELKPDFAAAYGDRGAAKYSNNDLDGALADFNKFVELAPGNPLAYLQRGAVKNAQGDSVAAIADASKAIELKSDFAFAYRNRGSAYYDQHSFTNALANFREASRLDPADAYVAIYIYLTRAQLNEKTAALAELRNYFAHRKTAKPGEWSSQIAKFLAGDSAEPDFLAAAAADKTKDREQHCEAYFYAGSKRLIEGDKKTAIADFKKCLATNVRYFSEYQSATAELKFLGQKN